MNINRFINTELNTLQLTSSNVNSEDNELEKDQTLKAKYKNDLQIITHYLITLHHSFKISTKKFHTFKNHVLKFLIKNNYLFRCTEKNLLLKRVVNVNKK